MSIVSPSGYSSIGQSWDQGVQSILQAKEAAKLVHRHCLDLAKVVPAPAIHMRVYRIVTRRSGHKLPRVEVEEMGPRIDFRVGRVREPDESLLREALKQPKQLVPKTKKNIETDIMGDKIGKIHIGKQDLSNMQTRKMKGLKRHLDVADIDEDMLDDEPAKQARLD